MVITSSDYEDYLLKEYFPSCQDKSHIITNFYHTCAPVNFKRHSRMINMTKIKLHYGRIFLEGRTSFLLEIWH